MKKRSDDISKEQINILGKMLCGYTVSAQLEEGVCSDAFWTGDLVKIKNKTLQTLIDLKFFDLTQVGGGLSFLYYLKIKTRLKAATRQKVLELSEESV